MKERNRGIMVMKKSIYYALVTFLFCFVGVPYTVTTKNNPQKQGSEKRVTFVFDMGGVLAKTSKFTVASNIGYLPILKRIFWHLQSFSSIQDLLYKTLDNAFASFHLDSAEHHAAGKAYDQQGRMLPYYMRLWLSGKIETNTIKKEVITWITLYESFFANETEKIIMQALIHAIFTPEIFVETHYITHEAMQLIKMLKSSGYQLFILSNWDRESFYLLKKKYADFFSLFDGIVVSGFEGCLKPDTKIYEILLERYNLVPSECLFIDDQFENIQAATANNMLGILCHDFPAISKVLTSYFIA
jgi:HAD superfamily hydrolase (TIGR01509 family)